MATIVLRGATNAMLEDTERAIDNGVNTVKSLIKDQRMVAGAGATELAEKVVELVENDTSDFCYIYDDEMSLWDKVKTVAQKIYGAHDIVADQKLRDRFANLQQAGYGNLPVCIAKTQYSFSTDPKLTGRPEGFDVPLRAVRLAAGAGFIVVLAGDVMTMPGLPKKPAAELIDIDEDGVIVGLF